MKSRSAKRLLFAAIVTAGVILQIGNHTMSLDAFKCNATMHRNYAGQASTEPKSCGREKKGLADVACDIHRDNEHIDNTIESPTRMQHTNRLWV
jgi:hypothetical protein